MKTIWNRITSILKTFLLVMFTIGSSNISTDCFGRDLTINLRSLDPLVSKQPLNGRNSQTILNEQSGECVAGSMESVVLRYTDLLQDFSQPLVCSRITADFSHQSLNGSITLNDSSRFAGKNIIKRNIHHEARLDHLLWIHCLTICSLLSVTKSEKRSPV